MAGATTIPSESDSGPPARNRGIPLDLVSVLGSYARHRMILIRLEQLPLNSDLSNGSYAGPRTWSLKPDELPGLIYTPPEEYYAPHTIKVRILSLNNNTATTLSVVDVPIDPSYEEVSLSEQDRLTEPETDPRNDSGEFAAAKEAWEAVTELRIQEALYIAEREAAGEEMQRLHDDLEAAKQELTNARIEFEQRELEQTSSTEQNIEARLKAAESEWQTEMARSVNESTVLAEKAQTALAEFQAKVAEETDVEIRRLQDELVSAKQEITDANSDFDHKLNEQASIAEQDAQTQLKTAEKMVRDEAAQAVKEAMSRAEDADTALARLQNQTDHDNDEALLRLGDDLAAHKETATEANARADKAEASLALARAGIEADIADLRQQLAAAEAAQGEALDESRRARGTAEIALSTQIADAVNEAEQQAESRLKAAEATWFAEAEKNLDKASARAEAAEKSLANLQAASKETTDGEVRQLGDELSATGKARDEANTRAETAETTLAQTSAETEKEIAQLQQRLADEKTAHAEANASLTEKIAEAVHSTEARAEKQLQTAEDSWRALAEHNLADATARAEQAEAELTGFQAKTRAASDKGSRQLEDELASAKQALADSEAALTDTHATFERKFEEHAATAEKEAGEHLKSAEDSWRAEAARDLDEMKTQAETAQTALAALQATAGAQTDDEVQRLGDELAVAKQALADSEAALDEARAALASAPEIVPTETDASTRTQGFLQKAQEELAANAERKLAEVTARAERAESELVKARMQVDRRSEDVVRDLEKEVKTLQLAMAAGEAALADNEAVFNRKLGEQRALYQQTAQKKAEVMLEEARKNWESEAQATALTASAKSSQDAPANGDRGDPPPATDDSQQDSGDKNRGWWRSLGMGGTKNS
ncbi:MAG: hypothetical protein V3R85_00260 [Alphaproteobacteria bacterium]